MGILDGKQGIIYGVRNERSLGWGCAQSLAREGARIAFSVFSEREEKDVRKLVGSLPENGGHLIQLCNLTSDEDIAALHDAAGRGVRAAGFRHSCRGVLAERGRQRAVFRYQPGRICLGDGQFHLQLRRCRQSRGAADDGGRQPDYPDLSRGGARAAELQHHGGRESRSRVRRCVTWRTIWGRRASASTPSAPGRP